MITLHTDSGVPIYLQVADGLRVAIAAGIYAEGEPVPSLRALAAQIRVNYHTIGKAYRLLEEEGVIARRRGGPFLVVPRPKNEAALELLRQDVEQLARRTQTLGVSKDAVTAMLDEAFSNTDEPQETS
jgi:GntR family transcriptional regulator